MNETDLTNDQEEERTTRERRQDLLDAVLKAFPADLLSPYGKGAERYGSLYQDQPLVELQGLLTGRMATAMRRWYEFLEKATKAHGLSLRHWQTFFNLAVNDPGETLTSIAARVGEPTATLVRILDDLEAMGLIARKIDERDRRSKLLDVTPLGEQTFVTLFEINVALRQELMRGLSASEITLVVEATDVMAKNLDRMAGGE